MTRTGYEGHTGLKILRIAVVALTVAGLTGAAGARGRLHAGQQSATAGAETSPPAKVTSDPGAASYAKHCAICHGPQREGILPAFPPLVGISHQMTPDQIVALVHSGKGRMPGFPAIQGAELTALVEFLNTAPAAAEGSAGAERQSGDESEVAEAGRGLFLQNCAFCHGRDAMGGESGPDLTQSKLVLGDRNGDQIAKVIREGRPENKMPAFHFSSRELASLVAFIHERVKAAAEHPGGRRGVEVADLQTGNADAGKAYFNGAGGCAKCHSPAGDLKGIASRLQGLQLEMQMLYPRGAKSRVVVTTAAGKTYSGTLAYLDEFTVGLRDADGIYHSWATKLVRYKVDAPAEAHAEQFPKYTDADLHNLMAYLQTLK